MFINVVTILHAYRAVNSNRQHKTVNFHRHNKKIRCQVPLQLLWSGGRAYLHLVAASKDGLNRRKRIYQLFYFHTVAQNHGSVGGRGRHDDARAIQKLDMFVQMHLLKAPEIQQAF